MGVSAHNSDDPWLNPEMLEWAREWRGLTLDDVAEKFKKTPDQIRAWELNEASPTVKQARRLAELYHRAFSEFFLPSPPIFRNLKPFLILGSTRMCWMLRTSGKWSSFNNGQRLKGNLPLTCFKRLGNARHRLMQTYSSRSKMIRRKRQWWHVGKLNFPKTTNLV